MAWGTPLTRMTTTTAFPTRRSSRPPRPPIPLDARSFPVRLPPAGTTTLVVDAASTLPGVAAHRHPGSPVPGAQRGAPGPAHGAPAAGAHGAGAGWHLSALTTQERFPLDLSGLAGLTLHGEGHVVIDAGLTANGVHGRVQPRPGH